jgi:UDP:flavonoid glycosyltransferase YjiC (YdhE family)
MARIDLVAPPFCGHLHPVLGLAVRLAREHEVRVLSTPAAQPAIAASGLEGRSLLDGKDREIAAIVDPPRAVGSHPLRLHRQLQANLALLDRFREELLALWAIRRPDLLIADFTVPVAGSAARALGIPWWTSLPSPCVMEAPDGPPAYLGGLLPRHDLRGRVRDAAGRALVHLFKRTVHRLHRSQMERLGYPSLYREDGTEAVYSPEKVLALGLPELEFPRRWPAAVELVGPVLFTPPAPEIADPPFREGRIHVLCTVGTHLGFLKDRLAEAAAEAARALPHVEIHVSDGDPRSTRHDAAGNLHRLGYVPYARHLERYALVVHHGGAGVMYHTLRAGRPSLVLPVDYDQFDHAARLTHAGVARRLRDVRELPGALAGALGDRGLRERAEGFAARVAAADGAERTAQLVQDRRSHAP